MYAHNKFNREVNKTHLLYELGSRDRGSLPPPLLLLFSKKRSDLPIIYISAPTSSHWIVRIGWNPDQDLARTQILRSSAVQGPLFNVESGVVDPILIHAQCRLKKWLVQQNSGRTL